jgi:hypothetical protein
VTGFGRSLRSCGLAASKRVIREAADGERWRAAISCGFDRLARALAGGGVALGLEPLSDDTGLHLGVDFDGAVESDVTVEQELGDVSQGGGVAAVYALEDDFAEEIAEEDVDGIGSGEVLHVFQ